MFSTFLQTTKPKIITNYLKIKFKKKTETSRCTKEFFNVLVIALNYQKMIK